MDRFLIRKVKLDASTVPANIQEEETSEKGNGEEKSARENPEGEPVSEAGTSTEQQDKLTNAEQMKTRKQEQVNVFQSCRRSKAQIESWYAVVYAIVT